MGSTGSCSDNAAAKSFLELFQEEIGADRACTAAGPWVTMRILYSSE
jgi:hypothetical protein